MKKAYIKIGDKLFPRIADATLLGSWEEVKDIEASTLKQELGAERLDGLILRGYEMKWNETNENFERYDKEAFGKFINEYYVGKGFNLPIDINHNGGQDWHAYCGRVLYIETNSVGFYLVAYVPRTFEGYDALKWRLQQGIIQGFSKEGYATEWEDKWKEDGSFDYELIKALKLISVSLVSTPANGVPFEKVQEVKNSLVFVDKIQENKTQGGKSLAELFNKK